MIKLTGPKLDRSVHIACSGGIDSMVVVDFLSRKHDVKLYFFDHGTETSRLAKQFLKDTASDLNLPLETQTVLRGKFTDESWEEYWRNQRYGWFHTLDHNIITCHHLNDCVETWIWSSMHGTGKIIPYSNKNVVRPFRTTTKEDFRKWADRNFISWIEDESNSDPKYMRNFIRSELMDKCLKVNPGLFKVIAKKVLETL